MTQPRSWLLLCLLSLAACSSKSPASASKPATAPVITPEVFLQAQVLTIPANTFNNPDPITMWGYGLCTTGFASCDAATVPGPTIQVREGTTLTIHLRNALHGLLVEPTSLIIPGQITTMTPVWIDPATRTLTSTGARAAGDYHSRVRSFTTETPADNATETVYTWTNVRAGTYLYQSGTHPQVQVQMGLYGALQVYPATDGQAYDDASSAFDNEATLVFSEIAPVLHAAVAAGTYGPNPNAPGLPPPGWVSSTMNYEPRYFLINGKPYSDTAAALNGGAPGQKLLLRLLNAGLETKIPTVAWPYMTVIAEDGNFTTITDPTGAVVPAPRTQYSVFLSAGKTVDALLTPPTAGTIPLFDRRMNLSNGGEVPGGMLAMLQVSAPIAALGPKTPSQALTARMPVWGRGSPMPPAVGDQAKDGATANTALAVKAAKHETVPASFRPAVARFGVEPVSMRLAQAGYMVYFRYRVTDAAKAKPLFHDGVKMYAVDRQTKAQLTIPSDTKLGSLRASPRSKPANGREYYVLFANPRHAVHKGSHLDVTLGELKLKDLAVE